MSMLLNFVHRLVLEKYRNAVGAASVGEALGETVGRHQLRWV
jgi:hypothetical protein